MARWFNTAGPCNPDDHYMLPATARLPQVMQLIDRKNYSALHAPRQTGKTTAVLTLAQELTAGGRYAAIMLPVEEGAASNNDLGTAELAILNAWQEAARRQLPKDLPPPPWPDSMPGARIITALSAWSAASSRRLIIFIDGFDTLRGGALISILS